MNNTSTNPVANYQNQQRIWNSVRVPTSEYIMNKASLTAYEPIVWNPQSDRTLPHKQIATVPSHGNSTKQTLTRNRPGAGTPGGVGCDIKFNSYVRYLNRLKGRSLKRGYISPEITKIIATGAPIPFNPAFPMYGGKYYKTNIISSCHCGNLEIPPTIQFVGPEIGTVLLVIGDLISWDLCKYAKVLDILEDKVVVQMLDKYGNAQDLDIIYLPKLQQLNVKKVDLSVFQKEDVLLQAHDYFINSLNSLDSICLQ
jgi:hypothetical protein